jgi:hypothetical protein
MNYIRHLTGFFERVAKDRLLNPSHIALYIAIFQFWNLNRFRNPISISRDELMRISKISSKATYHKCLKLLHAHGYLRYEPSYNPYRGSHVHLFNFAEDLKPDTKKEIPVKPKFEPVGEQVVNKQETSAVLVGEQALVPSINNTNLSNNQNDVNGETPAQNFEEQSQSFVEEPPEPKEKSFAKKEKVIPSLDDVVAFFESENYSTPEAHKFFNYYQSIGWLIGGKTRMQDWHAAAKNWMLNAFKFQTHDPVTPNNSRQLDTSPGKNYAEPL